MSISINSFEAAQEEVTKITRLKKHMRSCYLNMIEARELRNSLIAVKSKKHKEPWLKGQEQFWKKAYWKAANAYHKALS